MSRRDGPGSEVALHISCRFLCIPPLTIEVVLEEPKGHVGQMIDLGGVGAGVIEVGGVEAGIEQCRYAGVYEGRLWGGWGERAHDRLDNLEVDLKTYTCTQMAGGLSGHQPLHSAGSGVYPPPPPHETSSQLQHQPINWPTIGPHPLAEDRVASDPSAAQ